MAEFRAFLKAKSELLHMTIHILLGILSGIVVGKVFNLANLWLLILIGIFGNLIPDIDHIIYFFTYGKNTEYSEIIRELLSKRQISEIRKYIKRNHKYLTGLYSHTLISPIITSLLSYYFFTKGDIYLLTLTLSISTHFIYDIFEDLLFFGKLNKNWYLRVGNK